MCSFMFISDAEDGEYKKKKKKHMFWSGIELVFTQFEDRLRHHSTFNSFTYIALEYVFEYIENLYLLATQIIERTVIFRSCV